MSSPWFSRLLALVVIGVTALIYFTFATSFPLAEPDEARYAEVAREMLETGDWVTPQLNYRPLLDKPPLLYWLTAAAFRIFGVSEGVARLPVMIAALAGLWVTFLLGQAMYGPATGAVATILLATSPLYFGMGQVLTMDMLLTLCTMLALAAFWKGFRGDPRWYRAAYVAVAFGILAKGPIAAVLTGIPAVALFVRYGDRRDVKRALDPVGIVLAAVIVLPWYVAVEARNPGFLSHFLFHDHLQRFFAPWEHTQPFWFYAYVLPVALFPLGLLWVLEPRRIRLTALRNWRAQTALLASWAGTTILVFSASRSKLVPYVLPALPALAIVLAQLYVRTWSSDATRLLRRSSAALAFIGACLALAPAILPLFLHHPRLPLVTPYLIAASILLLSTAWLARRSLRLPQPSAAFCTLVAGTLGLLLIVEHGRVLAKDYADLGSAAAARTTHELVVYGHYLPTLGFYVRKPLRVFDRTQEEELEALWSSAAPLLVVANRRNLDSLGDVVGSNPPVIAEQHGKILIANDVRTSGTKRNRKGRG